MTATQSKLAIHGGARAVGEEQPKELFHWPIITSEDAEAVLDVLRAGAAWADLRLSHLVIGMCVWGGGHSLFLRKSMTSLFPSLV